ncbi:MAG: arginase family protein [Aminivibrio sp.]
MAAPVKIVDCGDADVLHGDIQYSFCSIEHAVRRILERGAVPAIMGRDHSITIPAGRALGAIGKQITVIQFDVHLDWTGNVGP